MTVTTMRSRRSTLHKQSSYPGSDGHVTRLDQASPLMRRTIGMRMARRRMCQMGASSDRHCEDGSTLVYRGGRPSRYDSSFHSVMDDEYTQVEFLDKHDVVLAANRRGLVDVVRLPRYCPPDTDDTLQPCRLLGTSLATKIEVNSTASHSRPSRLRALKGGNSFVVGLENGELCLFDVEYGSSFSFSNTCFPNLTRRCPRDVSRDISVPSMFRQKERLPAHRTAVIATNDLRVPVDNPQECRWDFRETGSGLLAAHVDNYKDCFSLRILDDRTSMPALLRSLVAFDAESTLRSTRDCYEDITSVRFVSEYSLASAHVLTKSQTNVHNVIKIWDIRRLARGQPAKDNMILPAFPENPSFGLCPSVAFDSALLTNGVAHLHSYSPESNSVAVSFQHALQPSRTMQYQIVDPLRLSPISWRSVSSSMSGLSAISPAHDCLVCDTEQAQPSDSHCLEFYDMTAPAARPSFGFLDAPQCEGRKRERNDEVRTGGDTYKYNEGQGRLATVAARCVDEYGCRARLTCIEFNRSATALIAGSEEGDLFLIRGI